MKGRFYAGKRTEEGLLKALQHFRQAIDLDPTYALAYVGLAQSYAPLVVYCHLAPRDAVPKIRSAAQHALDIDPRADGSANSACWTPVLSRMGSGRRRNREVRAVIALNPTSRWSLPGPGRNPDRPRAGLPKRQKPPPSAECSIRSRLNVNAFMAMTHYFGRQYDAAIEHGHKTIEMDPSFFPGHFWLGMAHQLKGEWPKRPRPHCRRPWPCPPRARSCSRAWEACTPPRATNKQARDILRQLDEVRRRRYVSQVAVAAIWVGLGESDRALGCLEEACTDRCYWLLYALMADPRFDPLRHEARFTDLVRRVRSFRVNAHDNPRDRSLRGRTLLLHRESKTAATRYPIAMFLTNIDRERYEPWLRERGQDPESVDVPYLCLVIDTGSERVLVDTGIGVARGGGGLLPLLQREGIEPHTVGTVILSHGHGDHVGGNLDADGKPAFPKARYVILRKEWDFWMSSPGLEEWSIDESMKKSVLAFTERNLSRRPGVHRFDRARHRDCSRRQRPRGLRPFTRPHGARHQLGGTALVVHC